MLSDMKSDFLTGSMDMFKNNAQKINDKYELLKIKYPCYNTRNSLSVYKNIMTKENELNNMYNKYLKSKVKGIKGNIVYHLWISGKGTLFKIETIETDIKSKEFEKDIQKILKKIKFDKMINECDTTVVKSYYKFRIE